MPNYKIFQDNPEQARIKIYGSDGTGDVQPLLTSSSGVMSMSGVVGVSGAVGISGSVTAGISGSVAVSGPIEITSSSAIGISGAVTAGISGAVGISGSVAVSGPIEITSSSAIGISGAVTAGISGSVAVSGPIEITSSSAIGISGAVTAGISGAVGISGSVAISGHSIVDSGPASADILPSTSGEVSGTFDVLGYSSWTLAIEYSGASGDGVHVVLEKSAVSGGAATDDDYIFDSSGTFASQNWLFLTTDVTPRYARLYYINAGTGSGTLYQTFQAQN